jgi:polyhydroxyalkanoate synthesis regulator protein
MSNTKKEYKLVKYNNRKLYDLQKSSYVSLHDVSNMIASRKNVRVTTKDSGQDITLEVLAEALVVLVKQAVDRSATAKKIATIIRGIK